MVVENQRHNGHFLYGHGFSRYQNVSILDFIVIKGDGSGSKLLELLRCANLQSKCHHQQTDTPVILQAGCPSNDKCIMNVKYVWLFSFKHSCRRQIQERLPACLSLRCRLLSCSSRNGCSKHRSNSRAKASAILVCV